MLSLFKSFIHRWVTRRIISVDIPPSQVNILNGNAEDLIGECNAYEERIKSYGGIELFLGGIGEDGHIAFNEPGRHRHFNRWSYCLWAVVLNWHFALSRLWSATMQAPPLLPAHASRLWLTILFLRTLVSSTMTFLLFREWLWPSAWLQCWKVERLLWLWPAWGRAWHWAKLLVRLIYRSSSLIDHWIFATFWLFAADQRRV